MKKDPKKQILELASSGIRPHDIVAALKISHVAVHKHLKQLIQRGLLEKRGRPPSVIYIASPATLSLSTTQLPPEYAQIIEKHFCYFTPTGTQLLGITGFLTFLERTEQAQEPLARAKEYIEILHKAEQFRDSNGLIDGTQKIVNTFEHCFLSRLYYSDFYSLPKYGKTKLGQYLLHGKSGQNINLIEAIAAETRDQVCKLISMNSIEAVAYAPHSIPRKIPFLKEYRRLLSLPLPEITLSKAFAGDIPIAQKSLSKLSERIENARQTIFVKDQNFKHSRILIIDDALGSGATINEIASKLKTAHKGSKDCKIFGYAVVGSYKGFEVIKEV